MQMMIRLFMATMLKRTKKTIARNPRYRTNRGEQQKNFASISLESKVTSQPRWISGYFQLYSFADDGIFRLCHLQLVARTKFSALKNDFIQLT
jgi:hypothetical protein